MPWETNKFTKKDLKPSSTPYVHIGNGGVIQSVGLNRVAPELIRGARISYFGDSFTFGFMNSGRMRQWKPDRWAGIGLHPAQVQNNRGGVNSFINGGSIASDLSDASPESTTTPWWPPAKVYTFTGNATNEGQNNPDGSGNNDSSLYIEWIQKIAMPSDGKASNHGLFLDYQFNTSGISGSVATSRQWCGGLHQNTLGVNAENLVGTKGTFVLSEEMDMKVWQVKKSGQGYSGGSGAGKDHGFGHCWNFPDSDKTQDDNYNARPRPWEQWNTDTAVNLNGTDNKSGIKPSIQGQILNKGPYVLNTFETRSDELHSNPVAAAADDIRYQLNQADFDIDETGTKIIVCHQKIERIDGKKGCVYSSYGKGGKTANDLAQIDDRFFSFVLNDYDNTEIAFVQFAHNDFNTSGLTGSDYIENLRKVYNKIMTNANDPDRIKVVFVIGNETDVTNSDAVYTDAAQKLGEFVKEYGNTAFINVFGIVKRDVGVLSTLINMNDTGRESANAKFFADDGSDVHPYNETRNGNENQNAPPASDCWPIDNNVVAANANFGADRVARIEWTEIAEVGNANNGEDPWRYSGIIETGNSTSHYVQNIGTCSYIVQASLDKENFIDIHSVTDQSTIQTSTNAYPYLRLKVKAKNVIDGYDPEIVVSQYVE